MKLGCEVHLGQLLLSGKLEAERKTKQDFFKSKAAKSKIYILGKKKKTKTLNTLV